MTKQKDQCSRAPHKLQVHAFTSTFLSVPVKNDRPFVKILNRQILYDPNFRMFFVTRKSIPSFAPSVYSLTTLIDFDINNDYLEHKLFSIATNILNPTLEERRTSITNDRRSTTEKLQMYEKSLLDMIASTDGPLLDNIETVNRVENAKSAIDSLQNGLLGITRCAETIEVERENYRCLVNRAANLFIALTKMARVNVFYQYSLTAFVDIFVAVMRECNGEDTVVSNVLSQICSLLTKRIYDFGVVGMMGRDKILFALQIAIKYELCDGRLEQHYVNFLVDSMVTIPSTASPIEWLTDQQWTNFVTFERKFSAISGIVRHFQANELVWREWQTSEAPESVDIPGDFFHSDNFMVF